MFEMLNSKREQELVAVKWALVFDGAYTLLGAAGVAAWFWKVHPYDIRLVAKLVIYCLMVGLGLVGFALDSRQESLTRRRLEVRYRIFWALVALMMFADLFR